MFGCVTGRSCNQFEALLAAQEVVSMTKKIERFFEEESPASPCLVVDLEIVAKNYLTLQTIKSLITCLSRVNKLYVTSNLCVSMLIAEAFDTSVLLF